ncbi:helix-turn-helix domain-containing protein [Streptomyces atroolivaceus]|uniref:helix-turn-helix domain-containing protein n=1 Tax=Streptomyces atroolivaceus TaxID=66869 RepID=UPI00364D2A28
MTPNGTAIRALRRVQSLSLRRLARMAKTSASQLSRIERGRAGAGDELIFRLAEALNVPVDDITRGEVMSTQELAPELAPDLATETSPEGATKKKPVPREVPFPGTDEGSYFHYTPAEAARFLPWSALQLKRKAYAREIPFNGGGSRVSFTGLDIRAISEMTAVRPLAETVPVQKRSA